MKLRDHLNKLHIKMLINGGLIMIIMEQKTEESLLPGQCRKETGYKGSGF